MATKKRSKTRGRAAKKANPFDIRNKPWVNLTEFERQRANDEIATMLELPMLKDAREGRGALLVAAALLVLPDQEVRLLMHGDEWGDGEGSKLAEHMVATAKGTLKPGESVRLDLVEVQVQRDGSCSVSVREGEGFEHEDVADIVAPSLQRALDVARQQHESDSADFWLVVLTTTSGDKRIVSAVMDDGAGSTRASTADIVRRARRRKWLEPGETIDRARLCLRASATHSWTARVTAEPDLPAGARGGRTLKTVRNMVHVNQLVLDHRKSIWTTTSK